MNAPALSKNNYHAYAEWRCDFRTIAGQKHPDSPVALSPIPVRVAGIARPELRLPEGRHAIVRSCLSRLGLPIDSRPRRGRCPLTVQSCMFGAISRSCLLCANKHVKSLAFTCRQTGARPNNRGGCQPRQDSYTDANTRYGPIASNGSPHFSWQLT